MSEQEREKEELLDLAWTISETMVASTAPTRKRKSKPHALQ